MLASSAAQKFPDGPPLNAVEDIMRNPTFSTNVKILALDKLPDFYPGFDVSVTLRNAIVFHSAKRHAIQNRQHAKVWGVKAPYKSSEA